MRYTSAKSRPTATFDAELEFKDAGLVAADGAAQVDSAAKVVNVGTGLFKGEMIIDVTAVEIASNDERYDITIQGCDDSSFTDNIVDLAILPLGALEVVDGDQDAAVGRYILPFRNEWNNAYYQYLRIYVQVSGSVATGINFSAYASKTD